MRANKSRTIGACLIAVMLSFFVAVPSAVAAITIVTDEPVTFVEGQTTVRFTREYEAQYNQHCGVETSYVQRAIIHNPGIPGGSMSARVLTTVAGPVGAVLIAFSAGIEPCGGFRVFELESSGGDHSPGPIDGGKGALLGILRALALRFWSIALPW